MKNKEFIPLTPFKTWVLENFPFIEDDFDAITSYQLWCKIVEYVKVIGANEEKLIKAFTELKDYVDNYFNNLDVQDEINNKLDEMTLDGTLERIINEEIFSDLNDTINQVKDVTDTIEPIVYDNEKNLKFPTYNLGMERTMRFIRADQYKSMQGFCFSTPNKILVTTWTGADNNNSILQEINSTSGIAIRSTQLDYGWTNGITYDSVNNLIYIIPRGENSNTYLKTIKILDYEDLSLINTAVFEDYIQSIYFDDKDEELYLLSEYGLRETNGFNIYKVDSRFNILNTINLDISGELNDLNIQNFAVHDNYIYLISSDPKVMLVYNMDGTLFKIYNLNEYINDLYYSGEYQDIDFLNDDLYLSSSDNVTNSESINQFFKVSLTKDYINRKNINTNVHEGRSTTLYVSSSSTSGNPDGSINNKFKSINEAIRCKGTSNILVVGGTYNGIDIRSKSFVSISRNTDTTDPDYNNDDINVKGVEVNYSNNIYLEDLTITQDIFNNNGYINLYKSDVVLKDISITGNKYGIYVGYGSQCKLSSGVTINTTADNQIYVRSESILYLPATNYNVEKHNESATIVGGVRMFTEDKTMAVGEFSFDDNTNYMILAEKMFNDYYKVCEIIYEFSGNTYNKRFQLLTSRNPMLIEEGNFSSNGVNKRASALVDFYENKFRIRYSKVMTTTSSGTSTVVTNVSNDNYDEDSIVIKNCILY